MSQVSASPEITAVVNRWQTAVQTRDLATIDNLLSAGAALHYIGTATGESWHADVLRRGIGDHFREVPEFHFGDHRITAFEAGSVGWATWEGDIIIPSTNVVSDYRMTFILVLENGAWKFTHFHLSNPTPNFEKLGIEHHAMDALMAAAKEGFDGLGREGMASVMFTDVVDSAALADLVGDRIWTRRIDDHVEAVRASIEDHGGRLIKSLGDGTMSTFTTARAALSAARAIHSAAIADRSEPVLRLRIGVHTGEVIETKVDFFGTVVNKAARINASAAPDEIRVSDETRIMLGRAEGFAFDDPLDVELKGLSGTHRIYRLA